MQSWPVGQEVLRSCTKGKAARRDRRAAAPGAFIGEIRPLNIDYSEMQFDLLL
jgi:hypothetical protein